MTDWLQLSEVVATALGTCVLTIMGIVARRRSAQFCGDDIDSSSDCSRAMRSSWTDPVSGTSIASGSRWLRTASVISCSRVRQRR